MAQRTYKRDARGQFASVGAAAGAVAGATAGAALSSKTARRRYIPGSLKSESYVGKSADGKFTGAKVGARYTAPGGREVIVKAIVGVSPPKRRTPAKAPAASAAAKKATSQSATSAGAKATPRAAR